MELQDYLNILRKRGWMIVALALLAAAAAFGFSLTQTKIYRATAKVSVVPGTPDWGLGNTAKDLLRNFVINIDTHDMAQKVIDRAQLDMTTYDLLDRTEVSSDSSNFTIQIDAKDERPEVAKQIALAMADIFVEERTAYYNQQDKQNRIEVKIVDHTIDAPLFRPNPVLNAAAGLVLGLVLGAMLVLWLEWLEADVLRTPQAIEKHLGLPVLGSIPVQAE